MKAVYGDESPSYDMVVRWKRNFQSGHMSLTDKPRAGRLSIKDDLAMVKKVEAVILDNRRSTMERVMAETGLSYGTEWRIIHEELHMNKVSARWVPRLLIPLQKQTRHDFSQQNLTLLEQNEDNFFACLITMDECWVYLYDPETKEMSKAWKHPSSPPLPRRGRSRNLPGSRGVLLTDLQKGETLNSNYYCNLLEKLRDALKQKQHGMISKGICLLADNAPIHTAQASVVTAHRLGYELLQHPPYSPDPAPSDFFPLPEMKKPLHGRRFDDREDVIFEVEQCFSSKAEAFYKEGLKQVKKRWQKCVTLQGDYMEKNEL
ncbi:hypothetical protein JRQ81_000697 [Phrynocephalus forsythii]|uniref:Transposase n=1 Tax=Phrynocephalus forsythii TaxID=171643 RepID=A0A9Q1B7N4_9SAUR|nr:hypothetical protein JRQ81_000697 [Phrynocephalus forsythii]